MLQDEELVLSQQTITVINGTTAMKIFVSVLH